MSYFVDWQKNAEDALMNIWLQSTDRNAVASAQDEIDRRLAVSPLSYGSLVSEGLYAIDVHPLHALFEIDDAKQVVTVVSVRELP
jgi:hypothetical protein